jgi:hypothetical protein
MRLTIVCLFAFTSLSAQSQKQVFVRVGNITASKATKTEILLQPFLKLHYVDAVANANFRASIYHFEFHAETGEVKTVPIAVRGSAFTPDVIACIKTLKLGSILCFEKIVVYGPDGTGRMLDPIKLTIR